MAHARQQREALRILEGIEEGTTSAADSLALVEGGDPALIYLIVTWLRQKYMDHPNSDAVIGRLLAISDRGEVAKKMKEGQADSIVQWFEDSYSYRELSSKEFIKVVVDKLEG
jgi:hypothetical protein